MPATINRYLATIRCLLRMARDEWQWITTFPKIRLLPGEIERDRWLNKGEAERLVRSCPEHLAAIVRFRSRYRLPGARNYQLGMGPVDLQRKTAWINQTKNGTPRGVPLNADSVSVLRGQIGKHSRYCFTYQGSPIRWELSNSAWHTSLEKAGIEDLRFHDLRHTWASWHRQAGTSCDELKETWGMEVPQPWWIAMRNMQPSI